MSAGESWLTRLLVWLAMESTLVIRFERSWLLAARPVETVSRLLTTESSCWSRLASVVESVLAESISWDTWPLRWSTVVVSAPRPEMIWATCVCLSLVMVASEVTRLFSALALRLRQQRVRGVLQLVELGRHRRVGDERARGLSGSFHPLTGSRVTSTTPSSVSTSTAAVVTCGQLHARG